MPQSVPPRSNAGHVGGEESVLELRQIAQRRPDLMNEVYRRLDTHQSVVRGEHASNNAVRWAPGERLNHLLEEACIRFATNDAVKLKMVTADNWEEVVELELRASQENLVASNLYSVAEAQFNPDARPRAVYAGKRVVGLLMYDVQKTKGKAKEASIYRFMIDRKHQRKGYGRAALSKALEEIRAIPGVNRISIRYMPKNPVAKQFYASFGFVEVGRDLDGEVIAILKL